MPIKNRFLLIFFLFFSLSIVIVSCSDDGDDTTEVNSDDNNDDDTGDDDGDDNNEDDDSDDSDDGDDQQNAALNVIKSQTILTANLSLGTTITYEIIVANIGNVVISDIEITDDNSIITGDNVITSLEPNASVIVTAEHEITQFDIDTGFVENSATVTGDSPNGTDDVSDVSDTGTDGDGNTIENPEDTETADAQGNTNGDPTDDPTITIFTEEQQRVQLSIIKSQVELSDNLALGDVINYDIIITNVGDLSIDNIEVTSSNATIGGNSTSLNPGGSASLSAQHIITQSDLDAGFVENSATATGDSPNGTDDVIDISDTGTDGAGNIIENSENVETPDGSGSINGDPTDDPTVTIFDTGNTGNPDPIDRNSLATNGCQNVVIVNGFAYAACGQEIEVVSLSTLDRNLLNIAGDDITADGDAGLLFTLDQNVINVLSLQNPMSPSLITSVNTNFSAFSGISAANGVLVVSAGAGGSNTQIYTYTNNTLTLATNGNSTIDNVTGNPDVHVTATDSGVRAFYSQDIGQVANWAIQIADIDINGQVTNTPSNIVLTSGSFFSAPGGPFGPSNFPVESEFVNDRLYIAHFAVPGIEIVDLNNNNQLLSPINLSYTPVNIATDGTLLFVVGSSTNDDIDVIDPATNQIIDSINAQLPQSTGVAANNTHIAVADRNDGLIIVTRQ